MRTIDNLMRRGLALALVATFACSDAGPAPGGPSTGPGAFESDLPETSAGSSRDGNAAGTPASAEADDKSAVGADAERAIVEADIIQVQGERLYALSRVAGLTVIDLTNPAQLKILGRYRELHGTPFEMYLRDGVVLAMYSEWGQYVRQTEGEYGWVQTSKVIALDVHEPTAITTVGSFDVPGEVSDSRIVGDVLYVVGYQNGYCWRCTVNKPLTSILSLNVKDPRQVRAVDELSYADANNTYGWNKRSVTVTAQRMYVAGPEYGQSEPTGSTIQVIDISSPSGDLVEGASVQAAGQISSRWQMDEHEGVLRVISQIPRWWRNGGTEGPEIQTFKVVSSSELSPLGRTPLVIPPNETLNTVRFDGVRGYAITSERKDPLFTIDLSDPAHPRQVGELEMPGWIYHLVPRGNRLIGLGYDQGNAQGSITVSVFDVTNLAKPLLLDRVNFGGDWAYLPEDQDRIHKAFRILDEAGLILVPFSGWSDTRRDSYCRGSYQSGVQLVDLRGDDLTLRGMAPSRGEARRAFLHNDRLVTVSDEAVDSYDLADRDKPAALATLSIARNVSHALPLANQTVARINEDWYGRRNSTIDIVALADVDKPERSLGEIDLSRLIASGESCSTYVWIDHAFAQGNQLNVSYERWEYTSAPYGKSVQVRGVLSIDAADAAAPKLLSKLEERVEQTGETSNWYSFSNYYHYGYSPSQANAVRTEAALVFLEQRSVSSASRDGRYVTEMRLRVVDLTDPARPSQAILPLPKANGYAGLVVDGNDVMLSHLEQTSEGRARFYLDRVDLSIPTKPVLLAKVNVPGQLVHYDRAHQRVLTSELVRTVVSDVTAELCYARFAYADFAARGANPSIVMSSTSDAGVAPPLGTCTGYREQLHMVRLADGGAMREDTYMLEERERLSSSSLGDARVAAVLSRGHTGWYGYGIDDCYRCGYGGFGAASEPVELLTLGGFDVGRFAPGRLSVASLQDPWWGFWGAPPIYAFGTRALVQSQTDAVIVDMTDTSAPTITRKVPLYATPTDLRASGNLVLVALMNGVQRIDL